jgi:hypothetical protein
MDDEGCGAEEDENSDEDRDNDLIGGYISGGCIPEAGYDDETASGCNQIHEGMLDVGEEDTIAGSLIGHNNREFADPDEDFFKSQHKIKMNRDGGNE